MKKLMRYGALVMALCVCVLATTSCGSNSDVQKYVDMIQEAKATVESSDNMDEMQAGLEKMANGVMVNSDYKLTDADKKEIEKAMCEFLDVCLMKGAEIGAEQQGIEMTDEMTEMFEAQKEAMHKAVAAAVEQSETLGELDNNIGRCI